MRWVSSKTLPLSDASNKLSQLVGPLPAALTALIVLTLDPDCPWTQKQQWAELKTLSEVPKRASALRWGPDARSVLVGAADHNLRVFSSPSA